MMAEGSNCLRKIGNMVPGFQSMSKEQARLVTYWKQARKEYIAPRLASKLMKINKIQYVVNHDSLGMSGN
jgi:hypothetical protein